MRVVGLDICKHSAVAICISERPKSIRNHYRQLRQQNAFSRFELNHAGLAGLIALKPDVAVLEPTGVHYSRLWVHHLRLSGVKVIQVGHNALCSYRGAIGLADKDDELDALALACYWMDNSHDPSMFLTDRPHQADELRRHCLRIQHLTRLGSPMINYLRQRLTWQLPELAKRSANPADDGLVPWLAWLAGLKHKAAYDRLLSSTCGQGLTADVRADARRLCELHQEIEQKVLEIERLLGCDELAPYVEVFAALGIPTKVQAVLVAHCYPLQQFWADGERPIIEHGLSRNGRPIKRRLSERRFLKALGVAYQRIESGDNKRSRRAGSLMCRTALHQWVSVRWMGYQRRYNLPEDCRLVMDRFARFRETHTSALEARSAAVYYGAVLLWRRLKARIVV